jgi:dTMP kinase
VVSCHDPGSTEVGERLRAIVLDRASTHLSLRSETLIYMASRAQLVDEVIRPSLAAGRVVITDRFLLSTLVYQGLAGGIALNDVWRVGQVATGGVLPDLTIVLDIPAEQRRARVGAARDRIEDRPSEYHDRVRAGFRAAAGVETGGGAPALWYPAPVVLINAAAAADAVFDLIKSEVERVLALGPRP